MSEYHARMVMESPSNSDAGQGVTVEIVAAGKVHLTTELFNLSTDEIIGAQCMELTADGCRAVAHMLLAAATALSSEEGERA